MNSIGLATYTIQIREKHTKKEYFKFDQIKKETNLENFKDSPFYDLIDIFNEILKLNESYDNKKYKKIIKLDKLVPQKRSRIICGLFGYGNYGNERTILDTKDKDYFEKLEQNKGVTEPFYFIFKLPKGHDLGMLIIERKSVKGLKSILNKWINQLLSENDKYNNFTIELKAIVDERIVTKYFEEGHLNNLKYIKNTIPSDLYDGKKKIEGQIETKVKFKQNNKLHIPDFFDKPGYLKLNNLDYDELKFEAELNGHKRIFRYGHFEDSSPYIDITDDVDLDGGNNPDFSSIDKIARKYAEESFEKIWKTD